MLSRLGIPSCGCIGTAAGCGASSGVTAAGTAARGRCVGARRIARAADLSDCGGRGTRLRRCPCTGWADAAGSSAANSSATAAMTRFVNLRHTAHDRN